MKNPNWVREEVILLVDTYFKVTGQISANNPQVIKLSEILNKLDIHQNIVDKTKFRNPSGISMKLANLMALDPNYEGEGLKSYSELDKAVFEEFFNNRLELQTQADEIRKRIE